MAAAALAGFALWRLPALAADEGHLLVTLAWAASIALYAGAVLYGRGTSPSRPPAPAPSSIVVGTLIALGVVGLVLRVAWLGSVPFVLGGDEAGQGLETLRVLSGEIGSPFALGRLSMPTATFFVNAVSVWLLGPSTTALRLPWALIGSATVLVTYGLTARVLGDRATALTAAALLAFYHYHLHYSRLALNNIADPLLVGVALLFLFRALDRKGCADWLGTGLVCGAALYAYPGARLTLGVVALTLACAAWVQRMPPRREVRGWLVALGAFALVAAPMIQYGLRFPDDFNARINQVGILHNGWLVNEIALRQQGAAAILTDQFLRAALAFHAYPDRTVQYGLPEPLLDPLFGALFAAGLVLATIRTVRTSDVGLFGMLVWWWSAVIFGGMLTDTTPSSPRLVTTTVPVCVFTAYGISAVATRLAAWTRVPAPAVRVAAVALFGAFSLHGYFVVFTPQRIAGGPHAELSTVLGPRLTALPPSTAVFFHGAPAMHADFPTLSYLARDVRIDDVADPLAGALPATMTDAGDAMFVILPHRSEDLAVLQRALGPGTVEALHSGGDGRLMATLYRVRRAP